MPVDYQHIQDQVRDMGQKNPARVEMIRKKRERGLEKLHEMARHPEVLKQRVEQARLVNPALRCAIPGGEVMDAAHTLPDLPGPVTLLAADGSQIFPDRHAEVEFSLVNVGAIQMRPGETPRESIRSHLIYHDQLYTPNGVISDEAVALMRDLEERRLLANLARQAPRPVVTLTDGQLEFFREPRETPEFARAFDEYLEVLRELCQLGVSTAGYVDRPKGDLVVRLLELALVPEEALRQVGKERPLAGITDEMLFNAILMNPGERSAVFAIQSISAHHFTGDLALHFFYLNVGLPGAPYLARVETPAWVIQDPLLLASLHATLIAQCRILGRRAFPYALHRAHEVAVVTYEDKNKLAEMVLAELNRQGIIADKSHKQSSKDLPGRTRHEL
jgi:hypothetical protein